MTRLIAVAFTAVLIFFLRFSSSEMILSILFCSFIFF